MQISLRALLLFPLLLTLISSSRADTSLIYSLQENSFTSSALSTSSPALAQNSDKESKKKDSKKKRGSKEIDSDADGVFDSADRCPGTPRGIKVDAFGCELIDADADGIVDSLDSCPDTPEDARGLIDHYGCPIDQDEDGIPDFRDSCPADLTGAMVDKSGCALDEDGDGIPDGLDLCPETLPGIEVDERGCVNLAIFNQPMIFSPDYLPGSFELDPKTKDRLKRLAGMLLMAAQIRIDIYSYTDDVGVDEANRQLSERRARRVHDFLVSQGIDSKRMRTFGRGESNFVASNETAEGRAKNRRLELLFLK